MASRRRCTFLNALTLALPCSLPSLLLLAWTSWDAVTRQPQYWWM